MRRRPTSTPAGEGASEEAAGLLFRVGKPEAPPVAGAGVRLSGLALLWQFIRHTGSNVRRSKVNYCLGFTACFVVVFVVALLVSVLAKAPVIYLRLGELNNGEVDVNLQAAPFTGYARFNYTLVAELLAAGGAESAYSYHTPRIHLGLYLLAANTCKVEFDPYDPTWKYRPPPWEPNASCGDRPVSCMWGMCPARLGVTVRFCLSRVHVFADCSFSAVQAEAYIIDNKREKAMSYGRGWTLPVELGGDEIYMSQYLANQLGVDVGHIVYGLFNMSDFVDRFKLGGMAGQNVSTLNGNRAFRYHETVFAPFRIKALYTDPQGKYPISVEDGFILEYSTLLKHLSQHVNPDLWKTPEQRAGIASEFSLEHYASEIAVNFAPPRLAQYMTSNYDIIQNSVVRFADTLLFKIGFTNVFVNLPILRQLRDTRFFSLFLGLILNVIIFILLFLSVVLIYSLLMISVETRTFELGILRMIGTTRRGIILLLLIQAFFYAIPALFIGLLAAQLANIGVSNKIRDLTGADVGAELDGGAIGWALLMGIATPVLSSILPIRSALGMNLQDSLDTKHSKTKAVDIKVERSDASQGVSVELLAVGVGLALFGGAIYYVFPLALLTYNLSLLMNIFVFLLLGMLLGLVMLALNAEHLLEKAIVIACIWWESPAIRSIVIKNLVAHRSRNRKTTIMYALSLGFIIFVNVAYNIEVSTFQSFQLQRHGAYFVVEGGRVDPQAHVIQSINGSRLYMESGMQDFMKGARPIVIDYAWATYEWRDAFFESKEATMSNLGRLKTSTQHVYGISPNFFKTAIADPFFQVSSSSYPGEDSNLGEALYSAEGSSRALIGSLYKEYNGLDLESQFLLLLRRALPSRPDTDITEMRRLKPLAFLDSAPRFTFSKFPQYRSQDVLLSIPSFMRMLNGSWDSVEDIPYRFFTVRLRDDVTEVEKEKVAITLRAASTADFGIGVWDFRRTQRPFEIASMAMNYIFSFTTLIAMAISFFSLMSSMFTNIHEQTKEIAILRALGVEKSWMYRIYIYEAFVLVMAASLIGILIGLLVGYTMTIQQALFTSFPLPFVFPWQILITVLVGSALFALLASYSPVRSVINRRVVQIFRLVS